MTSAEQENSLPLAEAAAWLVLLEDGGPADKAAYSIWVDGLPQRAEAFREVSETQTFLSRLDPKSWIDIDDLFPEGIEASRPEQAQPMTDHVPSPSAGQRAVYRWGLPVAAMAAALAVAAAIVGGWTPSHWDKNEVTYTTSVGEQRPIRLADGSSMDLNVESNVQVLYTPEKRDVRLLGGEVLFNVERDLSRPFRLMTARAVVQAQSTQFNIYHRATRTTISVIAGEVSVRLPKGTGTSADQDRQEHASSPGESGGLILGAGQQISIDPDGQYHKVEHADVANAVLWQKRRLRFDHEPLAEVAEEWNRYNTTRIIVVSENLGARQISGSFSVDHPETLVHYLQSLDDEIRVENSGSDIVIRSR